MKISVKILVLVVVFLSVIAFNGVISHQLLKRMGSELRGVVNKDVALMQAATAVTRLQLQKAIIFERMRRIAEELAYQETNTARKEHLFFQTKLSQNGFNDLAKEGALNIVNAKILLDESLKEKLEPDVKAQFQQLASILREIEKAHIHYDALAGDLFNIILSKKYEFSQDDLAQIHRDERKLTTELQKLVEAVQKFTQGSLVKAEVYERTAERILWVILLISLFVSLLLAISIIHAIARPLKGLVKAAERVGQGDLNIHLAESGRDEFGELSRTFNQMSRQLDESKKKLEAQQETLRQHLDITEKQKKDLLKVNHELDQFVHTVSHDIRSPLMGISWYADFLKKQHYEALDSKGRDSVDGVIRGVEKANALIRDLLTLTRLSRVNNPYQHVDVSLLLNDVTTTLEYKIKETHTDLQIQSNLPGIICDGIKLKEVFLNLITNAIKFSSKNKEVHPKVIVGYCDAIDAHEFFVKDNGIGIDPKHHQEIFDIFKRLDTAEAYEGTGAGLSIVKSIVEGHGGKVWILSEAGKGAEFHFSIPKGLRVNTIKPVDITGS